MENLLIHKRYKNLNSDQRTAVDYIEGPLMVVAGPGSGKTELLGLRTAKIIEKTDTPASSILCLTFTNAATFNMRERLLTLIGKDAYKVPVYTFHSFCMEIVNNYPELFFDGINYALADQSVKLEIIEKILENLNYDDPLKVFHPEKGYVYLKDIERSIFYLQDGGVAPEELNKKIVENEGELKKINKVIEENLGERVSKKIIEKLEECKEINANRKPLTLSAVIFRSLREVVSSGNTTKLSEWKQKMTRRENGKLVLKETTQIGKLKNLAEVYKKYQEEMKKRGYFTFSDIILEVVKALEENEDLRRDIQEKYLYVQVDEFQDTSGVQMKLLDLITSDSPEGSPNICVVGDDDQAIYQFQGADISNILRFRERYKNVKTVTLLKNYRSNKKIVEEARQIILKAEERLESRCNDIDKNLVSENKNDGSVSFSSFLTKEEQYSFVAEEIKEKIEKEGIDPKEIAVIAKTHKEIKEALCYLNANEIPSIAERKENVLEKEHIKEIINILRFSLYLFEKDDHSAQAFLPEILTYPFLGVKKEKIWEIAKESQRRKISWMDFISKDKELKSISDFLLTTAYIAKTNPAEDVIDFIIGNKEESGFVSNFRDFYFDSKLKKGKEDEYLFFLFSLKSFLGAIRKHRVKKIITARDVVNFVDFYNKNEISVLDKNPLIFNKNAVSVITAHSSKGREFDTVFVLNCYQGKWGRDRGSGKLSFPSNLPLEKAGGRKDERIRLFYVAATRSKRNLYFVTHQKKSDGKDLLKLEFISEKEEAKEQKINKRALGESINKANIIPYYKDKRDPIFSIVNDYKLSATGFNKFLNVVRGGPQSFFEENILHFPQRKTKQSAYGTAVHNLIKETYSVLKRDKRVITREEFFKMFESFLEKERLPEKEFKEMFNRGKKEIKLFYDNKVKKFLSTDIIEKNFNNQGCVIEGVPITGKIDKIRTEGNLAYVFDYKTGSPLDSWEEKDENKKIKSWQYKNQLTFYKLLIENSQDFSTYSVPSGTLEFIHSKEAADLSLEIKEEDVSRVEKLIKIIGKKIQELDFVSTKKYKKKTLKEIKNFERDLLEGKI